MPTVFYACLAVFGLAVGSFVNVLTLRYKPERSFFSRAALGGRSHCMQCNATLKWYELIPLISFVVQGGKCRSCGARLARQYPLVECAVAALAVGIPVFFSAWHGMRGVATLEAPVWYYGYLLLWFVAALAWLAIVIVDAKHYIVPDELNLALIVLGVGLVALVASHEGVLPAFRSSFLKHYALLFTPSFLEGVWVSHLAGAALGGAFFWLLSLVQRGAAMGFGDVKLAFASGLVLGFPDIIAAAGIAFVIGGLWGGILMAIGKKRIGDRLPFAPFLVVGFLITITLGFPLLSWYFKLLNF
jgi:prepilin signal peptidase PulO-like enzyme (type II secretory pathway)